MIVLGTLLGAMVSASALLIALEPAPSAPLPGTPLPMAAVNRTGAASDPLTEPVAVAEPERWNTLAVHFSGQSYGSAHLLAREHEKQGLGGLGYHFVIGNGRGEADGQIVVGYRWRHQLDGLRPSRQIAPALGGGDTAPADPRPVVDICLIGDGRNGEPTEKQMRQLVWLVQRLQGRLHIPADRVFITGGGERATRFPIAEFRRQLLSAALP
jgi:hypothetical protein